MVYTCQVSATDESDLIHVAPSWQKKGPRYDYVMIQGSRPNKPTFAQIDVIFSLNVQGTVYQIGIVCTFKYLGRHCLSEYIKLEKERDYTFIFLDSVIRAAHILPPTIFYSCSTVQDLVDGDMYLRLINMA